MMTPRVRAIASVLVYWALLAYPTTGVAKTLDLSIENDSFFPSGGDDYTSGLRFSRDFNRALWWSPFSSRYEDCHKPNGLPCRRTTLMVGQNFYTPQNITVSEVQEDERPYSAWLYVAAAARLADVKRLRTVELHLGTTGKAALGEYVQTKWHALNGNSEPQGWEHQVKSVPGGVGFIVIWDDKFAFDCQTADSIRYAEVVSYYRLTGGNVHTNAVAGATFRLGYNLQRRWTERIEPVRKNRSGIPHSRNPPNWSFYGFFSVEGRAVIWNALLQHDTYTPRELRPINRGVAVVEAGIGGGHKLVYGGFRLVWRSPEFDTGRWSKYGGVFFTINCKRSD